MQVQIKHLLDGAIQAEGLVVVIDVLRTCSTVLTLLNDGIDYIVPIRTYDKTLELKNENNIIVGELEDATKPPGFDYCNSPSQLDGLKLSGEAIINTGAGAPGIIVASHVLSEGGHVILGCFLNNNAVVEYIRSKNPKVVTIIALGRHAREEAVEDETYAKYLKSILDENPMSFEDARDDILNSTENNTSVKKYLDTNDDTHPKQELYFCLRDSVFDIVPKVYIENGRPVVRT